MELKKTLFYTTKNLDLFKVFLCTFAKIQTGTMINFNGTIVEKETRIFGAENRGFKYGDGLFETLKVEAGKVQFLEDHYFRLMAAARMIRMEIPMEFSMEFMEGEVLRTVTENQLENARVRLSVFRSGAGLYAPERHTTEYLIEASSLNSDAVSSYEVDIFKDFYIYSGLLSTIKSTNKLVNVIAATYASENELDNCVLLNEEKKVVEFTNGNLFLVKGNKIVTPRLTDGCVKGIIRKKLLEATNLLEGFTIEEEAISPFDLQKADELFMTNAIVGIQPITKYRKKNFTSEVAEKLTSVLETLV